MSATTAAWLVLALPLAGTLIISLLWRFLPGRTAGWIGTAAIFGSFVFGVLALLDLQDHPEEERHLTSSLFSYVETAGVKADMGILVDPLSIFMVLVVTGVSSLIHLYSVAYMDSDAGYRRYFAYLNFFVFSMLVLVLGGNFVLLIVGWAFVGFASYALISYWYRRTTATRAGMKAFVINVVGDVALVLAAFLLFKDTGLLDFAGVFEEAHNVYTPNDGTLIAACLLLLIAACAKSAQIPLHTWLADAMEGPTPVSALIHAATMVTAGVYLIARMHPLFEFAPTAADIAAIVGLAGCHRPEADHRLLHDLPDRLHDRRRIDVRARRGALPPDDPRVLQGAAVHGRGVGDLGDGRRRRRVNRSHGRLPQGDAVHVHHVPDRSARAGGVPVHVGLLLEGRDPGLQLGARGRLPDHHDPGLRRRGDDRDVRVPHGVSRVLRRPRARGPRAGGRPRPPRRAAQPGHRRAGGHRRRLSRPRPRDRRAHLAHEGGDVGARGAVAHRRNRPGAGRYQDARALPAPLVRGVGVRRDGPVRELRLLERGVQEVL